MLSAVHEAIRRVLHQNLPTVVRVYRGKVQDFSEQNYIKPNSFVNGHQQFIFDTTSLVVVLSCIAVVIQLREHF